MGQSSVVQDAGVGSTNASLPVNSPVDTLRILPVNNLNLLINFSAPKKQNGKWLWL